MTDASGLVALVTGATSGIGRALAQRLAASGAAVGLVARDVTRGEDTRAAIAAATNNPRIEVFAADPSSISSIRSLAADVGRSCPSLGILVNCQLRILGVPGMALGVVGGDLKSRARISDP